MPARCEDGGGILSPIVMPPALVVPAGLVEDDREGGGGAGDVRTPIPPLARINMSSSSGRSRGRSNSSCGVACTEREEEAALGREEGGMEGEDKTAVDKAVIKVSREGRERERGEEGKKKERI